MNRFLKLIITDGGKQIFFIGRTKPWLEEMYHSINFVDYKRIFLIFFYFIFYLFLLFIFKRINETGEINQRKTVRIA